MSERGSYTDPVFGEDGYEERILEVSWLRQSVYLNGFRRGSDLMIDIDRARGLIDIGNSRAVILCGE